MCRLPGLRRFLGVLIAFSVIATIPSVAGAKRLESRTISEIHHNPTDGNDRFLPGARISGAAASAPDITLLGSWDFEGGSNCSAQSWVSVDVTAPEPSFFHVDDFAGLGGGTYGLLQPLEGTKSMWCGARPNQYESLCGYATLPGYGNSWNQTLCTTSCIDVDTLVTVTFLVSWDTEPSYDFVLLEVDNCDENWVVDANPLDWRYADSLYTWTVSDFAHSSGDDSLRFRFRFTSDGAFSDADGFYNTDGAVIIDSILVFDGLGGGNVLVPLETFEDESVGAMEADDWATCLTPSEQGYGDFAGLFSGIDVLQENICTMNLSCMWGFFENSAFVYDCVLPQHPEQAVVPYVNGYGKGIENEIWSPQIPLTGSGSTFVLEFDVYRDLPNLNYVQYRWKVRSIVGGCPTSWENASAGYYGDQDSWVRDVFYFGDKVAPGATHIQIALGVRDLCPSLGCGPCHSHAPLFDNVDVYRIDSNGPVFDVRDVYLFNDTFASDGTVSPTSTARADAAIDIMPSMNPTILYGDSVRITVGDPETPLAADATVSGVGVPGSKVYMYLAVWPQGQTSKEGGAVVGRDGDGPAGGEIDYRYPVIGTEVDGNGVTWTCVRFDTAFGNGHGRSGPTPDAWCVDLNDNLFTTGDTICFFFSAENTLGEVTYYARDIGETEIKSEAQANPMEFTVLPAGGYNNGGDILYVDGMDGRGAQPFFDTAFDALGIRDKVDRYDIRAPSSSVSNRPGGRVVNVQAQITDVYRKIIWSTGDLEAGLIGDGTGEPEKADDAFLLSQFLSNLGNAGGVYFTGDNIADELDGLSGASVSTLTSFIQYTLDDGDHVNAGLGTSPYGVGTSGGSGTGTCFYNGGDPDTLIVYGGCPLLNNFDVISPVSPTSLLEMNYRGGGNTGGAVVSQRTYNGTDTVGVLLSGFSFHSIRDRDADGVMDRADHLYGVITWLENIINPPTNARAGEYAYALGQNYPNPFNPVTTIAYRLKEPGHVTLGIYNAAGQLVRTLIDGRREAGVDHTVRWDGTTRNGERVASGVYFYRLVAGDFVKTRKMVLLK